jgi:hypothetical protein
LCAQLIGYRYQGIPVYLAIPFFDNPAQVFANRKMLKFMMHGKIVNNSAFTRA